jgi:D-lactate dehydrogenase (quinone)
MEAIARGNVMSASRTCLSNVDIRAELRAIVGSRHVLTSKEATRRYRKGYRFGDGPVLAVARPGSLREMWHCLKACHRAGKIVIMQAANTGLTGGSTPDGSDYDRDIVIISTMRLATIHLIRNGEQVICLPGATLHQLEKALRPLDRVPHSVIGSSCIGASVFGGICNNSGGALIHRGPAFTQMTCYAMVGEDDEVHLVNHLGVQLGHDVDDILRRLEEGNFPEETIVDDPTRVCSDHTYKDHVRDIEAATPARFNADPKRLFEAAGSAGKVMLLAVRLDTFPKEKRTSDFFIGTNDPAQLTEIRRHILAKFRALPIEGEYMHRDMFDITERYGKDTVLAIRYLGTERLPRLFGLRSWFDTLCSRLPFMPKDVSDHVLQFASRLFPRHLPQRLYDFRQKYEHYLLLPMGDDGIEEARSYLSSIFPTDSGAFFECRPREGELAFLHRFAAAGASVRYRALHSKKVQDIVALDIALLRNGTDWFEQLPVHLSEMIEYKLYCGHFFCQVFHQDYIVKKGFDTLAIEHAIWKLLDKRGAEYPAEHNVGHLYEAKPSLVSHFKSLDPCNCFNPGVGRTTKKLRWEVC